MWVGARRRDDFTFFLWSTTVTIIPFILSVLILLLLFGTSPFITGRKVNWHFLISCLSSSMSHDYYHLNQMNGWRMKMCVSSICNKKCIQRGTDEWEYIYYYYSVARKKCLPCPWLVMNMWRNKLITSWEEHDKSINYIGSDRENHSDVKTDDWLALWRADPRFNSSSDHLSPSFCSSFLLFFTVTDYFPLVLNVVRKGLLHWKVVTDEFECLLRSLFSLSLINGHDVVIQVTSTWKSDYFPFHPKAWKLFSWTNVRSESENHRDWYLHTSDRLKLDPRTELNSFFHLTFLILLPSLLIYVYYEEGSNPFLPISFIERPVKRILCYISTTQHEMERRVWFEMRRMLHVSVVQ